VQLDTAADDLEYNPVVTLPSIQPQEARVRSALVKLTVSSREWATGYVINSYQAGPMLLHHPFFLLAQQINPHRLLVRSDIFEPQTSACGSFVTAPRRTYAWCAVPCGTILSGTFSRTSAIQSWRRDDKRTTREICTCLLCCIGGRTQRLQDGQNVTA
jgi:hypothetical protein